MGSGSTSGKYVHISSSLTKLAMNQYRVNVSISTSSGYVWNQYGMRAYAHIGGSKYLLGTFTISDGVPSTSSFSKTFTVSSNTSVYASCICSYCEDGLHSEDYDKFSNSTSADTAAYENPLPSKPVLVFEGLGNSSTVSGPSGRTVYSGTKSDGSPNYINFYIGKPGGATSTTINLQFKYDDSPTWYNAVGFPHTSSELYHRATKTFGSTVGRYSDRKLLWCAWATASNSAGAVSGDYIYYYINDLPTIDANAISLSTRRTIDSFTVNIPAMSDSLATGSKKYRIHLYKLMGGQYQSFKYLDVGDVRSVNIKLSDYGFNRGEWCKVHVEPMDALESSGIHYTNNNCTIVRNTVPKFYNGAKITTSVDDSPYNKYFLNTVTINIPAGTDPEDSNLSYRAYYRKRTKGGSWGGWYEITSSWITNRTLTATPSINKGEEVQFGAIVYDGLEFNEQPINDLSVMSQVLTKAIEPNAPSTITINPSLDSGTDHYEYINSISWSSVTASNGSTVASFNVGVEIKQYTNSSVLYETKRKVDGNSTTWDITTSNFTRGYYFRFKVTSIDMFGLESTEAYTQWFRKNRAPGAVPTGSFKINSGKNNFYQTIPLKWDKATDPDNDTVTYRIYFSKNKETFTQIATGISSLTYTHNIDNLTPGTTLGYKIVAYDKFGIPSAETLIEKCHSLVVNTPPNAPQILYPISKVYDSNPRILFQTRGDSNNDSLSVVVIQGGEVFNSATSSSMFNKTSFDPNFDNGIFIPKKLNEGMNTLIFKVFDGYQYSSEVVFNIEYKIPTLSIIEENDDVLISQSFYDKLTSMITDTRKAYGMNTTTFNPVIANETFVLSTDFNKLYTDIIDVNNFINNNYPGLNRSKTKPNISKNNLISKQVHNSILDVIINL